MYDATSGLDEQWFEVPYDTLATAMLARDHGVLFAQGSRLTKFYTGRPWALEEVEDLARFGVVSIDGMAIDEAANRLIVVDGQADAVFDIDLSSIAIE